jgi:glycosyltransferase involved in cell wall biosynthesis
MKFALVSHVMPPSWSGQAMILSRLLSGLTADDYCVISAQPPPDKSHSYAQELPGRYYHLPHKIFLNRGYRFGLQYARAAINFLPGIRWRARRISEIIRREGCDTVLACSGDLEDLPAAFLAARSAGVNFYAYVFDYYSHQFLDPAQRALARLIEPPVLKRADGLLVTNEILREALHSRYQLNATVLHNPCDIEEFDALARGSERASEVSGGVRIVYTGAIYDAHYDAFRNLLRALELLGREDIRLHLYTAQSAAELAARGITGPIVLHRHLHASAMPAIQCEADLLFLPLAFNSPYPELVRTSAPSKQPEYLAARRPILVHAPADSFISWYAREHDCGMVIDVCDPVTLAGAIRELLTNTSLCERLSKNARRRAISDFHIDKALAIFDRMLGRVPARETGRAEAARPNARFA